MFREALKGKMVFQRSLPPILGIWITGFFLVGMAQQERITVKRDRWFPYTFEKTWRTVISVVVQEGFSIHKQERGKGVLRTGIYNFPTGRFGPNVATNPPSLDLSWEQPIVHLNELTQGRCYLNLSVRPSGKGTRVAVAAVIQSWTIHLTHREMVWANRGSNGTIEMYLLDRVEKALQDETSMKGAQSDHH